MASQQEIEHTLHQYRSQLVGEPQPVDEPLFVGKRSSEAQRVGPVEAGSNRQYRQIAAVLRAALSQPRTSPSATMSGRRFRRFRAQSLICRATAWYIEHSVTEQLELYELLTEAIEVMDADLKSLHAQVSTLQSQIAQLQPVRAEESPTLDSPVLDASAQPDGGKE